MVQEFNSQPFSDGQLIKPVSCGLILATFILAPLPGNSEIYPWSLGGNVDPGLIFTSLLNETRWTLESIATSTPVKTRPSAASTVERFVRSVYN